MRQRQSLSDIEHKLFICPRSRHSRAYEVWLSSELLSERNDAMTNEQQHTVPDEKSQAGGKPAVYKIQIDKVEYDFADPTPTGRDLLTKAGKIPPEQFAIYLKAKGNQPQRIGLDESVDLREPGVERFVTLPLDQTEG
jgi:hypothetical protein